MFRIRKTSIAKYTGWKQEERYTASTAFMGRTDRAAVAQHRSLDYEGALEAPALFWGANQRPPHHGASA